MEPCGQEGQPAEQADAACRGRDAGCHPAGQPACCSLPHSLPPHGAAARPSQPHCWPRQPPCSRLSWPPPARQPHGTAEPHRTGGCWAQRRGGQPHAPLQQAQHERDPGCCRHQEPPCKACRQPRRQPARQSRRQCWLGAHPPEDSASAGGAPHAAHSAGRSRPAAGCLPAPAPWSWPRRIRRPAQLGAAQHGSAAYARNWWLVCAGACWLWRCLRPTCPTADVRCCWPAARAAGGGRWG